jgi:hypothetical protein
MRFLQRLDKCVNYVLILSKRKGNTSPNNHKPTEGRGTMTTTNGTPVLSPVAKIEALYDRLTRARTLVADNKVHPVYGRADYYFVEGKEAKCLVNSACICPDATNRPELKGLCKHKLAATIYAEQQAIANNPQVAKAVTQTTPSESERTLEDKLEDLYPKARPNSFPR